MPGRPAPDGDGTGGNGRDVRDAREDQDASNGADDPAASAAEAAPELPPRENAHALTVVGLGGSAGSIPALEAFFQSVPEDTGSAYVVVLHLAPEHESRLAELLSRSTRLPVRQVTETVKVEAGHVYVIPPGMHLEMWDGELGLRHLDPATNGTRVAVDTFFRALAESHGPQAAAVVLSGTGADGTLGIRRVKEVGGLAVAQSPGEAEYDAMPRNAIASGVVDFVLPAATMPAQIEAYWGTSRRMRLPEEAAPSPEQREDGPETEAALRDVLAHVRVQTGHDFARYKRATVLRRIGRRLQVCGLETLPEYLSFLRRHPAEVGSLVGDLLISVTQFFRDPPVWEALAQEVLPRVFREKHGEEEPVRAWVCGCATGEEAYTLAILLLEEAARRDRRPRIQIFATDMDADAVAKAREGVYPETITAHLSEERLRRWFYRHSSGTYQVRKEVREIVLFANHDVLKDTPFSRLDLITCRNLLIYLNREAQEQVFETFHFALRPDGHLVLGPSESSEGSSSLFGISNKQHRFYVRRPVARTPVIPQAVPYRLGRFGETWGGRLPGVPPALPPFELGSPAANPDLPTLPPPRPLAGAGELHRSLLELYAPPSVLIGADHEIIHLSDHAGRFLRMAGGEPTRNLVQLVHPDLRVDLRTALYTAGSEGLTQTRLTRTVELDGEGGPPVPVRLTVRPVEAPEGARGYFLVLFEELPAGSAGAPDVATSVDTASLPTAATEVVRQLEEENATLQRQLRSTIEQYEAITEELKASNEELQAMNEEQRSAAEELETSKEELQSVNEELSTLNHELRARVEEVSRTNSDLQNFLSSTDIGTIFLDRALQVKRFTPRAETLFNLIPTDVGRPLVHLTSRLEYPGLQEDAEQVLTRLASVEREIASTDGQRYFLARLLPYRSMEDRIEGVVVNFIDVTERKQAERAMHGSEERLHLILDNARDYAIFTLDPERRVDSWNPGAEAMFGYAETEILGVSGDILFTPEDRAQGVPARELETALREGCAENERWHVRQNGRRFYGSGSTQPLRDGAGNAVGFVKIMRDLTERKQAEERLRESEERYQALFAASPAPILVLRPDAPRFTITQVNSAYLAATMRTREEVVGRGMFEAFPDNPNDPQSAGVSLLRASLERVLTTRQPDTMPRVQYDIARRDGTFEERWWSPVNSPVLAENGDMAAIIHNVIDVTEEHRAEAALRESAEQFRRAIEEAPIPVIMHAEDGQVLQISRTWTELTGYTLEDVPTLDAWLTLAYGEGADAVREHMHGLFAGDRRSLNIEFPVRTRGGEVRHWSFSASSPGTLRDGRRFIVGMAVDITEREQAEGALRRSEERFRTLSDTVPQVIWTNEATGEATYFNRRWYEYSGLTYEESRGPGWQVLVHPDDADASRERWRESLATGKAFETEYRLRRRDGAYRWFLGRNVPLRDEAGNVSGWFGSATDIEELKQAQAAQREAQERLRLLVEGARDYAMFLQDYEGRITYWNAGAERLFGWTEEEALGQRSSVIYTPEDRAQGVPEAEQETALREGRAEDVRWHLRQDGSRLWADGLLMRLNEGDRVTGFAKVTRDATEHKRAQEELEQALAALARANQKLEQRVAERTQILTERTQELARVSELRRELLRQLVLVQEQERGNMARDLHDDTGQQVTGLLLGLDRLAKLPSVSADPLAQETVAQLEALAGEVAEKSHRLAVTLRPTALDDLGLMPAVQNFAQEWSAWSGVPVEVEALGMERRLPPEIETTVYRVVQEALTNIMRHAAAREERRGATRVSILLQRRETEVRAVVEDNGPGFDVDAVLSLPPGQRRLGIFGMQERARLAGGTLSIESAPGQGTTVLLHLPVPAEGQPDA